MSIRALMVDVDGVLVDGRPGDGGHWQATLEEDLGIAPAALHEHFFAPHWEDIVLGHAGLMERLTPALQSIAPHVSPAQFVDYWFANDSRLTKPLLLELSAVRASGIQVYLATNQEHLRAKYLMQDLGLAEYVDGIFYSARLGTKKPQREFFTQVQAAVTLSGSELLLIDDSSENVQSAQTAGWRALHWTEHSAPTNVRTSCTYRFEL